MFRRGRFRRVVAQRSAPFSDVGGNGDFHGKVSATAADTKIWPPGATAKRSKSNDSLLKSSSPELKKTEGLDGKGRNLSRKRNLEEDNSINHREDPKGSDSPLHSEQAYGNSKVDGSKNSVSNPGERRSKRLRKAVTKYQDEDPRTFTLAPTDVLVNLYPTCAVVQKSNSLMDHLLQRYRRVFEQSPRTKKLGVAMTVIAQYTRKGGRFLERKYRESCKRVPNEAMLPLVAQALHHGFTSLKGDVDSKKGKLLLPSSKSLSSEPSSRRKADVSSADNNKPGLERHIKSGSSSPQTSVLDQPNENDVLFGRGPSIAMNPGNLYFRSLVLQNRERYNHKKTSTAEKQRIARRIIAKIESLDPPGRFAEVVSGGNLIEALMPRVILKTMQALRECRRSWATEGSTRHSFLDYVASVKRSSSDMSEGPSPTKTNHPGTLMSSQSQSTYNGSRGSPRDRSNPRRSAKGISNGSNCYPNDDASDVGSDTISVVEHSSRAAARRAAASIGRLVETKASRKGAPILDTTTTGGVASGATSKKLTIPGKVSSRAKSKTRKRGPHSMDSAYKQKQMEHHINNAELAKRGPDGKYPMVSVHPLTLPSPAALTSIGLPTSPNGPPRLKSQDGELVKTPHVHDVLFGRGSITTYHPGNLRFRRIVWENKDKYLQMSRSDKSDFAMDLVNTIRNLNPPGRYLEFDEALDGYAEPPMRRILDKTLQALRENKRSEQTKMWEVDTKSKWSGESVSGDDQLWNPSPVSSHKEIEREVATDVSGPEEEMDSELPPGDDIYDKSVAAKVKVWARLSVYWPLDKTHYVARILDKQNYDVLLQYEDDDLVEWVDLTRHSFRVLG